MGNRKSSPAKTPEARLNQLVNLAVNEAEIRLRNGTASSQIITTLLQHATAKAQLELEKLRSDISLVKAKEKEIDDRANSAKIYEEALEAFKYYKGDTDREEDEYDDV